MDTRIFYREGSAVVSAAFADSELTEVTVSGPDGELRPGDIFVAQVRKMTPGIAGAFVFCGAEKDCFLKTDKIGTPLVRQTHADGKLHQGDEVIVQVEREEGKNKPATVVTDISLTGVYLVLIHGSRGIRVSSKINDEAWKKEMKAEALSWIDGDYTLMLRTNAYQADPAVVRREFDILRTRYTEIVSTGLMRKPGTRLYQGLPTYLCGIRDDKQTIPDRILVQDPEIAAELREFLSTFRPEYAKELVVKDPADYPLSAEFDMKKRFSLLTNRKVWLKSGAYLIIDPTEAMTVIDVNTGKGSVGKAGESGFLVCNMEAAQEIAKQIRLRNLSGIIMIDFINMKNAADNTALMEALKNYTKSDPAGVRVVDMTPLGLVEVTRTKVRRPLAEDLRKFAENNS
ncbi:MAG: ribonuclease E/G [Lachnospiraceae bacterium]|nr:ribonuclease E/G [Lachnospiraceae bacterium]